MVSLSVAAPVLSKQWHIDPAVLGTLQLQGMLGPVQAMVNDILGMLPNILAATVIGLVGWGLALIVRKLVTNLLAGTGADRMGENAGLRGTMPLSRLVGLVLYVFVLVPALIAALNALKIDAVTAPATEMLNAVMRAIPNMTVISTCDATLPATCCGP